MIVSYNAGAVKKYNTTNSLAWRNSISGLLFLKRMRCRQRLFYFCIIGFYGLEGTPTSRCTIFVQLLKYVVSNGCSFWQLLKFGNGEFGLNAQSLKKWKMLLSLSLLHGSNHGSPPAQTRVARFFYVGTIYQHGGKYTKLPQNIPNGHKIYQIAIK
jgi:hypothetical protein